MAALVRPTLEETARLVWEFEAYQAVEDQAIARRLTAYLYWLITRPWGLAADAAPAPEE